MAEQDHYPDLVYQRAHVPGGEERTFEDALRELLRNSPYLGVSLLIHFGVIGIFILMPASPTDSAVDNVIQATQEEFIEPIPPEPPPPEKEPEEIEEIIEDPVISEEEVTEIVEIPDNQSVDAPFESTSINDVIGVGGGGGGNFGKLGRRGSRGAAGGSATQKSVEDALQWLANHQHPDGYWSGAEFDLECGKQGDDVICDGIGSPLHDVGLTGLSLLAFLGAGYTTKSGKYRDTVRDGLKYLTEIQDRDSGAFADDNYSHYTYDHIIATLAMVEAYALTKQHILKKPANNALQYMYDIRNQGKAWRYAKFADEMADPATQNDMSVTGWAILAMTLAKEYDLNFDEDALEDSYDFLDSMTDGQGRTGYLDPGGLPVREAGLENLYPPELSESMTAVGVLCRIFIDPELERPGNEEMIEKGADLIVDKLPEWEDSGARDFYYWYYGSYALYQLGGSRWKKWEDTMVDAVVESQYKEGERKGSWDTQCAWGRSGGRVYSTAIMALCLEVFYRYDTVMGAH